MGQECGGKGFGKGRRAMYLRRTPGAVGKVGKKVFFVVACWST